MITLPRTVGPYTIFAKLETGGVAEAFLGRPTDGDGAEVVIRRVLPFVCADPERLAATEARVRDLIQIRHPFLVPVIGWLAVGRERFIVEEFIGGETLAAIIAARKRADTPLPANVFLSLATQICNGLEALHGRPGNASGTSQVLHLGLRPGAIMVTSDGKVVLGSYGLVRSPTLLPHGGVTAPSPVHLRYLAPEQTLSDAELSPASDIFSLGSILFELATNRVLFEAGSNLRTIHAVRRAEVDGPLESVRKRIPGLDRVLTRALAQNPRFRYHRAFVLREDLRGLMASYSFSTVAEDTRAVLDAVQWTATPSGPPEMREPVRPAEAIQKTAAPLDPDPFQDITAALPPDPDETPLQPADALQERTPAPPPPLGIPALTAPVPGPPSPQARSGSVDPGEHTVPDPVPAFDALSPLAAAPPPRSFPGDDDPEFTSDPESEFSDVELEWDKLADDVHPSPEDLPAPRPLASHQTSWATTRPAHPDDTASFKAAPAPLPPSTPLPQLPSNDVDGRPVQPNETSFLPLPPAPAPPTRVAPSTAPPSPDSADEATRRNRDALARAVDLPTDLPPPPPALNPRSAFPATMPPPLVASPPPAIAPQPAGPAPFAPPPLASPPPSMAGPEPMAQVPTPPRSEAAVRSVPVQPISPTRDQNSGKGLLLAGVGMAAVALMVCAGVGVKIGMTRPAVESAATRGPTPSSAALVEVAEAPPEPTPSPERELITDTPAVTEVASASTPASTPTTARPQQPSKAPRARTARPRPPRVPPAQLPPPVPTPSPPAPEDTPEERATPVDISRAARTAARGGLDPSTRRSLEQVSLNDSAYTQSRVVLSTDAAQRGKTTSAERYLEQAMVLPENHYNPVLLSQLAMHQVNHSRYAAALDNANKAEQHWARIPSSEMYERKATIYEVQAAATQGLLYQTDDERTQQVLVEDALRRWTRFREHATAGSSSARVARADTQIEKLRTIRARLE